MNEDNENQPEVSSLHEQGTFLLQDLGSTVPPRGGKPNAPSDESEEAFGSFARAVAFFNRPRVRVWLMPLGRGLGTLGILCSVAFIGAQSKEAERYGQRMELGERPIDSERSEQKHDKKPLVLETPDSKPPILAQSAAPIPCAKPGVDQAPRLPGLTEDGKIIMNEATQEEFTKLPGVGASRAEAIVQLRTRMKKFRRVSDLLRVRGIGWKTLQTMKEKLVVDRPKPPPAEEKKGEAQAPKAAAPGKTKSVSGVASVTHG